MFYKGFKNINYCRWWWCDHHPWFSGWTDWLHDDCMQAKYAFLFWLFFPMFDPGWSVYLLYTSPRVGSREVCMLPSHLFLEATKPRCIHTHTRKVRSIAYNRTGMCVRQQSRVRQTAVQRGLNQTYWLVHILIQQYWLYRTHQPPPCVCVLLLRGLTPPSLYHTYLSTFVRRAHFFISSAAIVPTAVHSSSGENIIFSKVPLLLLLLLLIHAYEYICTQQNDPA